MIFVLIPVHNEAATVGEVVHHTRRALPDAQIIVVDDGSTDGGCDELHGVTLLRHAVNRGQGAALRSGIKYALAAGADIIVTFDADGQHQAEDIAALIQPIVSGERDVVLGSRFLGAAPGMPLSRKLLLKLAVLFTRIVSGVRLTDCHNGLRAFSAQAARNISITQDGPAHASEIIEQVRGWRYREVPVTIRYTQRSLAKGQKMRDAVKIGIQACFR